MRKLGTKLWVWRNQHIYYTSKKVNVATKSYHMETKGEKIMFYCQASGVKCQSSHNKMRRCYAPSNERHWGWSARCLTCDSKTWKSVHEQSDEVHKAILNPTYAKTSSMFPNLITFKFMLNLSRKRYWISIYSNFVRSIWLTMLLVFVDCK
jgi:hypothetical protein